MRNRPRYTVARNGLQATVPLYLDQVTVNADGFITDYRIAFLPDFIDPGDIKAILREAISLDEPERCEVYDEDDRWLEGHPGTPRRRRGLLPALAAWWLRPRKTLNANSDRHTLSDRAAESRPWPPHSCLLSDDGGQRDELIAVMRRVSRGPGEGLSERLSDGGLPAIRDQRRRRAPRLSAQTSRQPADRRGGRLLTTEREGAVHTSR